MNTNIFCSRKGGATVNGKFFPQRASSILADQVERYAKKMELRRKKREAR